MEKRIVEMSDNEGNAIFIEAEIDQSSLELVADDRENIIRALSKFEDSLQPVVNLSKSVITKIRSIDVGPPSEIELNFSLKLSGKLDFWVISSNGEGNIELKLKWVLNK